MKTHPHISGFTTFSTSVFPVVVLAIGLAACSKTPADTKESLSQDPERLKAIAKACHDDPKSVDEQLCRAAAHANFQKFMAHKPSEDDPGAKSSSPTQPAPKF